MKVGFIGLGIMGRPGLALMLDVFDTRLSTRFLRDDDRLPKFMGLHNSFQMAAL